MRWCDRRESRDSSRCGGIWRIHWAANGGAGGYTDAAIPEEVVDLIGYALHLAQIGRKHPQAKPLRGFGGAGVVQIVEDHRGDTYRAVCTTQIAGSIYVLHCFQKKSTHGIATPKHEIETITARLRAAQLHAQGA